MKFWINARNFNKTYNSNNFQGLEETSLLFIVRFMVFKAILKTPKHFILRCFSIFQCWLGLTLLIPLLSGGIFTPLVLFFKVQLLPGYEQHTFPKYSQHCSNSYFLLACFLYLRLN